MESFLVFVEQKSNRVIELILHAERGYIKFKTEEDAIGDD